MFSYCGFRTPSMWFFLISLILFPLSISSKIIETQGRTIILNELNALGSGISMFETNVKNTDPAAGYDPGVRLPVFNLASTSTELPAGIQINECGACSVSFQSNIIYGTASFQSFLDSSYTLEGSGSIAVLSGRYSASVDFKSTEQTTSTNSQVLLDTAAICCVYTGRIVAPQPPPFSSAFNATIYAMPSIYAESTKSWFAEFLNNFGTSIITGVSFGCRFGQRSTISNSTFSKLSTSNLQIKTVASLSAIAASGSSSLMTSSQKNIAETFNSLKTSSYTYQFGGSYPSDGQVTTWTQSCAQNSLPIGYTIRPFSSFLTSNYFPKVVDLPKKVIALNNALQDRCLDLVSKGFIQKVSTCTNTLTDPGVPKLSVFGGLYSVGDCSPDGNIVNPYTKSLNCPLNYQSYQVGRAKFPDGRKCGTNIYMCVSALSDPLDQFGGMYQKDDSGSRNSQNNPFTRSLSCPKGYLSIQYGRLRSPESGVGSNLYFCWKSSASLPIGKTSFGGLYQLMDVNDKSTNHVSNVFTNARS
jgi:hypothetical protein